MSNLTGLLVATPTLNCAATLRQTLTSVAPLVAAGAKHIIIDSGSTDGTGEIARASGATVLLAPRGNLYLALNKGFRECQGEWLTYINGDDLLHSGAVKEVLATAPLEVDVIYGNIDYIDETGRFLFAWRSPSPAHLATCMRAYSAVPQQGAFFRRQVFDELGGFDTRYRYSADYDFWVRALAHGFRFQKYSARTLAAFRLLPTQLSQKQKSEMAPEGRAIRQRLNAGKPNWRVGLDRVCAAACRWSLNVDNYCLRATRGRGVDRR